MEIGPPTLVSTGITSTSQTIASSSEPLSGSQDGKSTSTPSQVSIQSAFPDVQTAEVPSGSPIQATAFAVTTTDFLGDVLTLTFQPAAFPTSNDGLVPVSSGATLFAVTTTVTYVTHSSTDVVTLTFTTDLPTNFSPPLNTSTANHTRVASIVGGTFGSIVIIALLVYGYIVRARHRHRRPVPPVLEPLVYEPNYTQPPEKSGMVKLTSCVCWL
ncbi:hypothetical protein H0H93_001337 [Arthromyces matolae]|nr:hypothetical protein H0H93_001337 [Arthromyces matolae]